MNEKHVWVDAAANPWTVKAASDLCDRCGRTPDAHIAACGTPLGTRLAIVGSNERGVVWQTELYSCGKPGKVRGEDGLMRCVQHARMALGLSGKWTGRA